MKLPYRTDIQNFTDIPNIGKSIATDLRLIGLTSPEELIGRDPYQMYDELCVVTGEKQDPCVIDVFISAVRYMEGGPPKKWWEYTAERKKALS